MTIKEKTIQELEALEPDNLAIVYELILSLKSKKRVRRPNNSEPAYMRVRKALSTCEGSFSDDIVQAREDQV